MTPTLPKCDYLLSVRVLKLNRLAQFNVQLCCTKILRSLNHCCMQSSFSLSFPTQVGSAFMTAFLHFLLSLASVPSGFFSFISLVTQSDPRLFGLPLALTPCAVIVANN